MSIISLRNKVESETLIHNTILSIESLCDAAVKVIRIAEKSHNDSLLSQAKVIYDNSLHLVKYVKETK